MPRSDGFDTLWFDINLGTVEWDEDGGRSYSPKLTERVELTRLHNFTSMNLTDDIKEIMFQVIQRIKDMKRTLKAMEDAKR